MRRLRATLVGGTIAVWLAAVALGSTALLEYQNTPGAVGVTPSHWPLGTALGRSTDRPTLVMLAHPRCPCTRASIGELARLVAARPDRFETRVVFVAPRGSDAGFTETDLWRSAAAIPGVQVLRDDGGLIASRLGSLTSGEVLLFDADGRRLFAGGITVSRGHAGDSVGRSTLLALLDDRPLVNDTTTAVFGCPLRTPSACDGDTCLRRQ